MAVSGLSRAARVCTPDFPPHASGAGEDTPPPVRWPEARLQDVWEFLRISELMMLDLFNGGRAHPEHAGRGHPQFGCLLYGLHHAPAALLRALGPGTAAEAAWQRVSGTGKPATAITPVCYARLRDAYPAGVGAPGAPALDGLEPASPGFEREAGGDWHGLLALVELLADPARARPAFGASPHVGTLRGARAGTLSLAIVGEGDPGATDAAGTPTLLKQMRAVGCDYAVHLGQVSPPEGRGDGGSGVGKAGGGSGRLFALNSGRAMCAGAQDYLRLLRSGAFRHQNQTSYFAASYGKWVILGLDSARHARPSTLYGMGALGEEQVRWIREYRRSIGGFEGKQVLVLTHHEGQDHQGGALAGLHEELVSALGRAPDVWYWGHLHGTIAYSNASAAGRLGTRARCVGHAAPLCPFTPGLTEAPAQSLAAVDYCLPPVRRRAAGFAMLELSACGGIVEKFHEPGRAGPAWQAVNGTRFA